MQQKLVERSIGPAVFGSGERILHEVEQEYFVVLLDICLQMHLNHPTSVLQHVEEILQRFEAV